jgi:hypothetical protein
VRRRHLTLRCVGSFEMAIGVCAAKVPQMAVRTELQAHDVERRANAFSCAST